MANMEHFNRQCAKASGRQHVIVAPLRPGGGADTGDVGDGGHAQLSGPDPSDPCSKIASCDDKSQDDGCDKSAAEILQWVATSCCDGAPRGSELARASRPAAASGH